MCCTTGGLIYFYEPVVHTLRYNPRCCRLHWWHLACWHQSYHKGKLSVCTRLGNSKVNITSGPIWPLSIYHYQRQIDVMPIFRKPYPRGLGSGQHCGGRSGNVCRHYFSCSPVKYVNGKVFPKNSIPETLKSCVPSIRIPILFLPNLLLGLPLTTHPPALI